MPVFFVHDPARRIVTPLDRKYHIRDIPPASELEETGRIHQKVELSTKAATGAPQRMATTHYKEVDEQEEQSIGKVGEFMSHQVISAHEAKPLTEAWKIMQSNSIHHLAIVNDARQLVGVLSESKIAACLMDENADSKESIILKSFCEAPVLSTHPDVEIHELATGMLELQLSGIPVTEGSLVVGMITRSDILKVFLSKKHLLIKA